MRRISEMNEAEIIAYNLRDDGQAFTVFANAQYPRVERARGCIRKILNEIGAPAKIIELGCSTGDISGPFAGPNMVLGIDVTPGAVEAAQMRYPKQVTLLAEVTEVDPQECDILVLCEFLEHIIDPVGLVEEWMPLARYSVIGHPLNDPGGPEPGHIWSYTEADFGNWFNERTGHVELERQLFSSPFPEMIMGIGKRDW